MPRTSRSPAAPPQAPPIEWAASAGLVGYAEAVAAMEARAAAIADASANELVWLLQHPSLYTAGTSAKLDDLLEPERLPVHRTGRGGQFTYHGPGQRIAYVMLDMRRRAGGDVRAFVHRLERWLIDAMWGLGIDARVYDGRVGVWVERPDIGEGRADKIAAIGIRVRRGVSFHGVSINVDCNLAPFAGIVPCGITDQGVTSLAGLGLSARMPDMDRNLRAAFEPLFGTTVTAAPPLSPTTKTPGPASAEPGA